MNHPDALKLVLLKGNSWQVPIQQRTRRQNIPAAQTLSSLDEGAEAFLWHDHTQQGHPYRMIT